jgi:hypothetical protein
VALLCRLIEVRYAIIDLCLLHTLDSQLLSLPRGQDLTHCSGGNGYIRLAGGVLCGMLRECGPPILDLLAAFLNGNW